MTGTRTQLWALAAAVAGTAAAAALFFLQRRRSEDQAAKQLRVEERIRELTERDAELERQISVVSRGADDLQRDVRGLVERDESTQQQIATVSRSADDLQRDVRGLVERDESTQQQIKALEDGASNLKADLEVVSEGWVQAEDRAKRSEEQSQGLASRIGELVALGERLDEQVAGLIAREFEQHSAEEVLKEQLKRANADRSALKERVTTLEGDLQRLTAERDDAVEQAERMSKELGQLQERFEKAQEKVQSAEADRLIAQQNLEVQTSEFLTQFGTGAKAESAGSPDVPSTVETFAALVEVAREHLNHIELPASAERELDALDAAQEADFWAQDAWLGLRALDEYARRAGDFTGGFWEWCKNGDAEHRWPASQKKLAMKESDSVTNSREHRRQREFEVSTELKSNGRLLMHAHLKVAEGGGQNIPRIYFYDDVKGGTGKVHIGFIGPHRLVPNKHTS